MLPESGSDIKGHMRSSAELLAKSGYASRPEDFDDLIYILDSELRLITPTDPEGAEAGTGEQEAHAQPFEASSLPASFAFWRRRPLFFCCW
jgi:hypothetical protein